ncbi:MAG: hypothetical protein RL722_2565, partial [Pseudomonadota bacterium]
MSTSASSFKRARSSGLAILVALGTAWPTAPQAASADIANQPLGSSSVSAKPNVMFILDDSGSMDSAYMPDDMRDTNAVGYRSVHCNGVAYDPTQKYDLPIKADGTRYPAMEFGNALDDGYDTSSGRVNLGSSGPNVYYTYKGSEPALNWRYGADGRLQTNTFSDECRSLVGSTTATAKFDAHTVLAGTDEAANYANWYSYYRKRYLLMRSAVGLSFASLDANYRVGFTVISDEGITGNQFLNTSDFDQTQRTTFYSKLYSAAPSSFTPLRGALSKVGRYYGNAISGQSYDPASYAVTNPITGIRTTKTFECQRNYAILSTDGYWNTRAEDFSAAYNSGFDLQGNPVGQQDGNEARPMKDGSSTVIRTVTTTGSVDQVRTDTNMATDATYSRSQYIVTAATVAQCGRTNRFNLVTNEQTGSLTSTFTRSVVEDVTTSTTITVTNTNGVITTTTSPSTVTRTTVSTTNSTPVAGQATWTTTRTNTSNCQRSRDLPNATGGVAGTTYSPSETGNQQGGTNTRTLNTLAPVTLSTTNLPGTPVTTETVTNGDSNSLADIAEYYYKTDLRPTINNNVKAIGRDTATWQHMTTYTVGLGVNGSLAFDKNYLTNDPPTGDYAALINGTKVWPTPSLLNGGNADATHVDDLWHAAVNGRGQYFSAGSAGALSSAITATLADVKASIGTASAAASSTLTPSASDDWLFMSRYN